MTSEYSTKFLCKAINAIFVYIISKVFCLQSTGVNVTFAHSEEIYPPGIKGLDSGSQSCLAHSLYPLPLKNIKNE